MSLHFIWHMKRYETELHWHHKKQNFQSISYTLTFQDNIYPQSQFHPQMLGGFEQLLGGFEQLLGGFEQLLGSFESSGVYSHTGSKKFIVVFYRTVAISLVHLGWNRKVSWDRDIRRG